MLLWPPLLYIPYYYYRTTKYISKDIALQMALKAINNSIGPNSLIPTLLVFGVYLYIIKFNILNPIVDRKSVV